MEVCQENLYPVRHSEAPSRPRPPADSLTYRSPVHSHPAARVCGCLESRSSAGWPPSPHIAKVSSTSGPPPAPAALSTSGLSPFSRPPSPPPERKPHTGRLLGRFSPPIPYGSHTRLEYLSLARNIHPRHLRPPLPPSASLRPAAFLVPRVDARKCRISVKIRRGVLAAGRGSGSGLKPR